MEPGHPQPGVEGRGGTHPCTFVLLECIARVAVKHSYCLSSMLLSLNAVPKPKAICPPHYSMHTSAKLELMLGSASQHVEHVLHDHSLQI